MKAGSQVSWFLAILVSLALVFAPALPAQEQSAGQISREIPNVNLQHGSRVQPAAAGAKVLWGDLVTTDRGGLARISLDDGSVLNVGSNSQLRVVQHDAASQRTQINLLYGKLRASAVHLARAGSDFEVRTPTAIAGVVGTEFALDAANNMTGLEVYEGSVTFCNLTGQCVTVAAGYSSTVRGKESPSDPVPIPSAPAAQNGQGSPASGGMDGAAGGPVAAASRTDGMAAMGGGPVMSAGVVGSAGPSQGALVRGAALLQGTNVFNGDVVEVGPGGESALTFGHNAMARLAEQSAVRASRDAKGVGLELLRGRMVYRSTPEQPVVGTFADALVRAENGQESVAIVAFRNPSLVVITAERGPLEVTAGRDRRTVSVPEGQTVEVSLSDLPANASNTPPQDSPNNRKRKGAAMWWTTGVILGGGTALGVGLALSANQPSLTCAQRGALVSPYAFPCD